MGDRESKATGSGYNEMASAIAEVGGMVKLEELQQHKHEDIYNKVRHSSLSSALPPPLTK